MKKNVHRGSLTRNVIVTLGLLWATLAIAQPTVLGTQLVNGTYTTYNLTDRGGVRFVRLQATSAGTTGTRNWEFATGVAGAAVYTTNWRPYTGGQTVSFNALVDPSTTNASARYNTGSGGASGLLPAITNGSYYTVNVGKNSTADNFMSILATTYNPKDITNLTRNPSSPGAGVPVTVTITTSASLSTNENAYLRYSTDGFATSSIVAFGMTGASGTAVIPGSANAPGATISYYAFTTNQSSGITHANADYLTLNLYNASGQNVSGSNFSYTIGTTIPSYSWSATGTAAWNTATNWTPSRTSVGVYDQLTFSGGGSVTITGGPVSETIGSLTISNNTTVEISTSSAPAGVIIANGQTGADFSIASGSALNAVGGNAFVINLATGATGSISGNITFSGSAGHQILPSDAGSLTFNSGATLTQGTNATGNIFGSSGTANAVVFNSGATFVQLSGANPFGLTQPSSRVTFNPGSLYRYQVASGTPAFNGRTYANFEFLGNTTAASPTGAAGVSIDNLTISSGTLNVNVTGTSSIKGNISVATGAALSFTPGSATTFNLNGSSAQTISTAGTGTITVAGNATLAVANGTTANIAPGTVISGAGTFNVLAGGTLGIGSTAGIAATGATGNVQTTTRGFVSGANYVYKGTANQITGSGLPSTVNSLTINNTGASGSNVVTLSSGVTTATLTLTAGRFDLNSNTATIVNSSGTGTVAATSGDFVTSSGTVAFTGTGSVSGTVTFPTVTLTAGVNFGTASTIGTALRILSGGFVNTNAPSYASGSTLRYESGGVYVRGVEWSAASGNGYPHHVVLTNSTTLNPGGTTRTGTVLNTAGNFTINAASAFYMDYAGNNMTVPLIVNGNLVMDGNLSASAAVGGDVIVRGDWSRTGVFVPNNRAVFFQGSANQTLTGATTFDFFLVDKTGGTLTLANSIVCNQTLTFTATNTARITTGANQVTIGSTGSVNRLSGWVNGNLQKNVAAGNSTVAFEVGDSSVYAPVSLAFSGVTGAGSLIVRTDAGDAAQVATSGLDSALSVNRNYTLTNNSVTGGSYNATFNFDSADVDSGANTANFVVRRFVSGWFATTIGARTSSSTQALNLTAYGLFQIGEPKSILVAVQPSNQSACSPSGATFTSSSDSDPAPSIAWQRGISGVYSTIDAVTDGGVYSGFTTTNLVISSGVGLSGYTYRAVFTNINGSVTSNPATFTLDPIAVGGSVSGSTSVCAGANSGLLTLSGHVGTVVQWESAVAPFTSWTPITNTTTTYTSGSLNETTKFRAVLQSGSCPGTVTSTDATISVITTQWDGTAWSDGLPSATKTVVFEGNYNLTADMAACALTVNSGDITVGSVDANGEPVTAFDITVSGPVTVNGGSLTFEQGSNLLQPNYTGANTGNIVVKTNVKAWRQDYIYWGSPVSGQNLFNFSPLTLANRFYTFNPSTNAFVQSFTGATDPALATTTFTTGKGYMIRTPNTFPNPTAPGAAPTTLFSGQFTGVPNNGTVTLTTTNGASNVHMISNPYPSTVNADATSGFLSQNPGTLYFWTHTTQQAGGNNYAMYNNLGGTAAYTGGVVPNGTIQVGQGFLFQNTSNLSSVSFTNAMRVGDNNGQFFRSANGADDRSRIWLNVAKDGVNGNQILVGYTTEATIGLDASMDGILIPNGTNIYTLIGGNRYGIQARPAFTNDDVVPMGLRAETAGMFTVSLETADGVFAGDQDIFLKDNLTGVVTNLKQSSYTFTSEAGDFNDRLQLQYVNTTLGIPGFDANTIVIYKDDNQVLNLHAGAIEIKEVKIFDIRGRLVYTKKAISANAVQLADLKAEQQVLLVQITSADGRVVTKKVAY